MGFFVLETERLLLRPYSMEDLPALSALLGDDEGMVSMGGAFDAEGSRSWIERNLARYERDGFGRYAVFAKNDGALVGDVGLIRTTVEGSEELELGWIVDLGWRGRGIATEAATAWRDHAFTELGVGRFISMVAQANIASQRVAEKNGMTLERIAEWTDGLPYRMYAIQRPSDAAPAGA